ncbi:MAG TPA: short-chain dehydrogenase, partial [Bellilinea sp.]|nr:short-chain dehydrogenase [Bellilinea sp.]
AISPERGAQTSIYLASSPEVAGVTGEYFVDCKRQRSSLESYNENIAHRLWDVSLKLTGLAD